MKNSLKHLKFWQKKRNELQINDDPQADWLGMQSLLDTHLPVNNNPGIKKGSRFKVKILKILPKVLISFSAAAMVYTASHLILKKIHQHHSNHGKHNTEFLPADSTYKDSLNTDSAQFKDSLLAANKSQANDSIASASAINKSGITDSSSGNNTGNTIVSNKTNSSATLPAAAAKNGNQPGIINASDNKLTHASSGNKTTKDEKLNSASSVKNNIVAGSKIGSSPVTGNKTTKGNKLNSASSTNNKTVVGSKLGSPPVTGNKGIKNNKLNSSSSTSNKTVGGSKLGSSSVTGNKATKSNKLNGTSSTSIKTVGGGKLGSSPVTGNKTIKGNKLNSASSTSIKTIGGSKLGSSPVTGNKTTKGTKLNGTSSTNIKTVPGNKIGSSPAAGNKGTFGNKPVITHSNKTGSALTSGNKIGHSNKRALNSLTNNRTNHGNRPGGTNRTVSGKNIPWGSKNNRGINAGNKQQLLTGSSKIKPITVNPVAGVSDEDENNADADNSRDQQLQMLTAMPPQTSNNAAINNNRLVDSKKSDQKPSSKSFTDQSKSTKGNNKKDKASKNSKPAGNANSMFSKLDWGVLGGVNPSSSFTSSKQNSNFYGSSPVDAYFGLFATYNLNDKWAVGLQTQFFSPQSVTTSYSHANGSSVDSGQNLQITASRKLYTLNVPINVFYKISDNFSVMGGPVIGIPVKQINASSTLLPATIKSDSAYYANITGILNKTNYEQKLNFGFNAGVNFEYGRFVLGASYLKSLTGYSISSGLGTYKSSGGTFQFTIGFKIGKAKQ